MKLSTRIRIPSPAMVVACLALTVALSGASYAAVVLPRNSVGTVQLKANAVNSAKVKDRSLKAVDFGLGQLPAGPQGPAGAQGPAGPQGATGAQGATGPAGAAGATNVRVRHTASPVTVPANGTAFASVSCLAGERATGGGGTNSNFGGVHLKQSYPEPLTQNAVPTGWNVSYENTTATPRSAWAFVVCASP